MNADAEFLKLVREMLQSIREDTVERQQRGDRPTSVYSEFATRTNAVAKAVRQIQSSQQQAGLFGEEGKR